VARGAARARKVHHLVAEHHIMRNNTNIIGIVVVLIAVIGAVNWGLIGFFNFNLVDAIFGGGAQEQTSAASRVVYAIVGLCGLAALYFLPGTRATRSDIRPAHV
jgi:uncharacterized membrane protein YuzA (DUF378 family)